MPCAGGAINEGHQHITRECYNRAAATRADEWVCSLCCGSCWRWGLVPAPMAGLEVYRYHVCHQVIPEFQHIEYHSGDGWPFAADAEYQSVSPTAGIVLVRNDVCSSSELCLPMHMRHSLHNCTVCMCL